MSAGKTKYMSACVRCGHDEWEFKGWVFRDPKLHSVEECTTCGNVREGYIDYHSRQYDLEDPRVRRGCFNIPERYL